MTALDRLYGGYYNSGAFSGANPGGLANGGHVTNFPAAVQDIGTVAQSVGADKVTAVAAANAAAGSAGAVAADRQLAQNAAGLAVQAKNAAETAAASIPTTQNTVVQNQAEIRARGPVGNGSVALTGGSASKTGYLAFLDPTGLQIGYIGYAAASDKLILIQGQDGGQFKFTDRPFFGTATPWDTGNFNPDLKANLAAAVFGSVGCRVGTNGYTTMVAGTSEFTGYIEFRTNADARVGYIGFANKTSKVIELTTEGGGVFQFSTRPYFGSATPWDSANDGSGSGLDADYVRGMYPSTDRTAGTLAFRDSSGKSSFGQIGIGVSDLLFYQDNGQVRLGAGFYADAGISGSTITERSDERLKRDIVDYGAEGRLRPRTFTIIDTGEHKAGFVAQEVQDVVPEAVRLGLDDLLEVNPMALIAHLSAQLNAALDRIERLEARQ